LVDQYKADEIWQRDNGDVSSGEEIFAAARRR
jgi:hypothetical protein